jgi:hypothetical protein
MSLSANKANTTLTLDDPQQRMREDQNYRGFCKPGKGHSNSHVYDANTTCKPGKNVKRKDYCNNFLVLNAIKPTL